MENVGDIITEVLVRNNRTTTDAFITDAMLQDWTRSAHNWASAYKKWPFTEGRISTTYAGTEEIFFEGYKADSIRFIKVGNDLLQKVGFKDYQQMKDEQIDSSDKVYTDFGRMLFINVNADISGTLTAYGQYQPVIDPTDLTATTIFSGYDSEGNDAIVEKVTSYLKKREHLPDEVAIHEEKAKELLESVWGKIGGEQFAYHNRSGDGMFSRFDVLEGGFKEDLLKRDQF